jgi:Divergent InlB B-repeat domain
VYKLTVVSDPALGGNFTYNPPLCEAKTYASGTVVTVTATALDGFEFGGWSGDIGNNAPGDTAIRVTMSMARSITAHFIALYTVLVAVNPGSGGTVSITTTEGSYSTSANQTALSIPYALGTTLQLSAIPAAGYKFDSWSGNLTGYQGNMTQGNITLVVSSPEAITAEFSKVPTPPWDWIIGGIAALLVVSFVGVSVFRGKAKKPKAVTLIPDGPKETEAAPITDTRAPAEPEREQSPPASDTSGDKS